MRWIEVTVGMSYVQAVLGLELLVFAWDIIFEVAMRYVSFFTIPYYLGFIPSLIDS